MKKNPSSGFWLRLVSAGILTCSVQIAAAQLVPSQPIFWRLGGNPSPPNPSYQSSIGTNWAAPLIFETNNISRGWLTTDGNWGINTPNPQNRLEINGDVFGNSGLRFSTLNNSLMPTPNPGSGLLSLDSEGDVIWVESPFNMCGGAFDNYLIKQTAPGQFCTSAVYEDPISLRVGVNTFDPRGRFEALSGVNSSFFVGETGPQIRTAGFFESSHVTSDDIVYNVGSFSQATLYDQPIIIDHVLNENVAGLFLANSDQTSTSYGVYTSSMAFGGNSKSYGIYATASGNTGNTYAGFFEGKVVVTGTFSNPSDRNLKENIQAIERPGELLNKLRPVSYQFKDYESTGIMLPENPQFGLIAQEVEEVLPQMVTINHQPAKRDGKGNIVAAEKTFKGVEYQQLIPLLIGAYQDQGRTIEQQQALIESQQADIEELRKELRLISEHLALTPAGSAGLKGNSLGQNHPNPFSDECSIEFNIDREITKASILLFDQQGKLLKSLDVQVRGYGKMTIPSADLAPGIYNYSLELDGKIVDSRRMVKSN